MAVSPVNRLQAAQGPAADPADSRPQDPPAPVLNAERSRRGQPADQVVFSQEARDQAAQARTQQEDPVERGGRATRSEFDRRQEETQAFAGQAARADERRSAASEDRGRAGLDLNA